MVPLERGRGLLQRGLRLVDRKRRRSIDVPPERTSLMGKLVTGVAVAGLAMTIAFAVYVITL